MQTKFYHKNFEEHQHIQPELKSEFVAVRMEASLFRELKQEAIQKEMDLSEYIRFRLREGNG